MSHPKGVLLEKAQKLGLARPEFRTEQTGPEHEPSFLSDVVLDGEVIGTGQGGTKRTAEKHAAEEALAALEERQPEAAQKGGGRAKGGKQKQPPAKQKPDGEESKKRAGGRSGRGQQPAQPAPVVEAAPEPESSENESGSEEPFDGPWPMFDDLLASAVTVAERRVFADLRGEEARVAIRDFSLALYKDLLMGLGDLVDEDEEEEEEED